MGDSLHIVLLLVCGYAAISALEFLTLRRELAEGGLLSWENERVASSYSWDGPAGRALAAIYRYPNVRALYLAQLVLAGALALDVGPTHGVCGLFLVTWLISQRTRVGQDGADQMALLVLLALSVAMLVPTHRVQLAACAFIAAEGLASYAIAGFAKLSELGWRDGSHLAAIFSTEVYGAKPFGDLLKRHRTLAMTLSVGFIFWECSVVFAMLAPRPIVFAYLAVGLLFHSMNALVMGLNTFLFAFAATYPATLYLLRLRPW